ncbi:MOSC domain-containing protein [Mucilaginibacter aquatilis]|uniref:MOSC domain-containing protein n=1 Tax=Mucilaginibacter aquatilis TaxID=1517760 RepID=A0A6I4ID28_9SPHI|nr:MOSC domain-containing protein [Mucilaginibacter aquatilis]MVN92867.1 MOSC domain-containing protein [Mucilaginibacter aquatilis]
MKLSPNSPLQKLMDTLPQQGLVTWIGVRPQRGAPLLSVQNVEAITLKGLAGDHFSGSEKSKRQVTLIQQEHIDLVASVMQLAHLTPDMLRRNIVVEGINLHSLKDRHFWVGNVLLEYTGDCHPCSRMEDILGPGGYNAMRGHGGITARILQGGNIGVNDKVFVEQSS